MTTQREEKRKERKLLPLTGLVLFIVAAVSAVVFIAIAIRVVAGNADAFDRRWTLAIHGIDTEFLDWVFFALTTIGSGPCLWAVIVLVGALAWRKHRWHLAAVLAANAVLAQVVNETLKSWFVRARPMLFEDEITRPRSWSFPSGHSMSAVAIWGAIAAVLIALYPQRRWLIVPLAVALIAGIGLSRVYLGVHWPTDVFAGFVSGVPFLAVSLRLIHRITAVTRPQ